MLWPDTGFVTSDNNSSSLLDLHKENKNAKYTAITTLSAANAAATNSGGVRKISETATKFTAPPI